MDELSEAGQHWTVRRGMCRELCVPLKQRSTDQRALPVVSCENTSGDFARRSFQRCLSRRCCGCCKCGTDGEASARDHEADYRNLVPKRPSVVVVKELLFRR